MDARKDRSDGRHRSKIISMPLFEPCQVAYDATLPSVNVFFTDLDYAHHHAARSFPILHEHLIANRTLPGDRYVANIAETVEVIGIDAIATAIAECETEADFALVLLEPSLTKYEVETLEQDILTAAPDLKVFFVGEKNETTSRRRLVPTKDIPTLSYKKLGEMAALEWETILAKREMPRVSFLESALEMCAALGCSANPYCTWQPLFPR